MKALTLMNFVDSYTVSSRSQLFLDEISWVIQTTGSKPSDALFIPYAYKGSNYASYFSDVSAVFAQAGISLTDIGSGNPAVLIPAAKAIVVGGGDINTFINRMNSLVTPAFNPYDAIRNKVDTGTPYIGWNEGSNIASPKYFTPPASPLPAGISASPYQAACHYQDSPQNRAAIASFLNSNPGIKKLIGQVDRPDGSTIRLEEAGGGMIDSATEPFPYVIRFELSGGVLVAS